MGRILLSFVASLALVVAVLGGRAMSQADASTVHTYRCISQTFAPPNVSVHNDTSTTAWYHVITRDPDGTKTATRAGLVSGNATAGETFTNYTFVVEVTAPVKLLVYATQGGDSGAIMHCV